MTTDLTAWLPDGLGLSPLTIEMVAESDRHIPIHLRLTSPGGVSARGACDRSLGELWSGIGSEVNCPACLELVHA